jgi:phosphate transport system permease protein
MASSSETRPFTGRGRRKQTRWSVRFGDGAARWSITVGGIGTIVAVSLVFLFLVSVVAPLFLPARLEQPVTQELPGPIVSHLAVGLDEFQAMAWWIDQDGALAVVRTDTGETLTRHALVEAGKITSVSTSLGQSDMLLGTEDGAIRAGTIVFSNRFPEAGELPEPVARQLETGRSATWDGGVVQRTPQGQLRLQKLESRFTNPVPIAGAPIQRIDHLVTGGGDGIGARETLVALVTADGASKLGKLTEEVNQFSGESSITAKTFDIAPRRDSTTSPVRILLTGRGENILLVWEDGLLQRFDVRDTSKISLVEEVHLLPTGGGTRVTACAFVLGRETLVVGDSAGGLRAWFRVRQDEATTADGQRLTLVHELSTGTAGIRCLGASARGRTIVAGYDDGALRMFQVTTERRILEQRLGSDSPVLDVAIAPKEDGLFALTRDRMWTAGLDPRHPEATLAALFRPVWYEGYSGPLHIWQSSSATSAPEMKLGLMPLVHGTLKATFYAMLFATPLAVLAAIYTSEFLHPRLRTVVKPAIEMMASLPSVVLGFLAALVFAVVVEKYIPQMICAVFCLPFTFLLSAGLWQTLPRQWTTRWGRWRVLFFPAPLILGILFGFWLGPHVERGLLAGDVMRWLDGQIGTGVAAWMLLWLPLCMAGTAVLVSTVVNPWLRSTAGHCTRTQFVWINLLKFLAATVLVVVGAYGISWILNAAGWDPRGTYVSTYVQRNAFVVGIVMGFAVIPIIFTIADDALHTVPQHLRSASLGCGATPWQTAIRVVVPTAMSGLFSAVMIGLGRAVGETMIVLMAGGNTPIMEWNLFNGFRTLAANIAVEMPEAVRDSTHYRTLFLAALTLFLMTFAVNTVAELVRIRFRKRAFQL